MMPLIERLRHIFSRTFTPGHLVRKKYQAFRSLLEFDSLGHSLMARLEQVRDEEKRVDFCFVRKTYLQLSHAISAMIEALRALAPTRYEALTDIFEHIDQAIHCALAAAGYDRSMPQVLLLDEIPDHSERLVGGKAANLAAVSRNLQLPIPAGFVVTARAFQDFIKFNRLEPEIEKLLAELNVESTSSMKATSEKIMTMIKQSALPADLEEAMSSFCARLVGTRTIPLALRSSAVAEDSEFSFAGQYRSVLNVASQDLVEAYKEVIASKYSARALSYRIINGLLDSQTPMAVLVIQMLNARASGILYTQDPFSTAADSVKIYSVWGLADPLVKGSVSPDVFEISKDSSHTIKQRERGTKRHKAVLAMDGKGIELIDLDPSEAHSISLDDESAKHLTAWGLKLESHFGVAQDVEWCMDFDGKLYVLQTRPLKSEAAADTCQDITIEVPNEILLHEGEKAASGKATGKVAKILSDSDLQKLTTGSVLVAPTTSPEFAQVITRLSAIVTDVGSVAGHLGSVAREHRIPTLVNTGKATYVLHDGRTVTVDADRQIVFAGEVRGLSEAHRNPPNRYFESPVQKRLQSVLKHVSPLNLTDPRDASFTPENCRTINDILRFAHEKAIAEVFSLGEEGRGKFRGTQKLKSAIPVSLHILDLGDGIRKRAGERKQVSVEDLNNPGLRALWQGLSHSGIDWSSLPPAFDWQEFDRVSAGIVDFESTLLASFALVSKDYLNINIRFGYHFVVIDSVCGQVADKNYISMRFEGGGGGSHGRRMRVQFLSQVLQASGFKTYPQGDWIEADLRRSTQEESENKLQVLGRLLGYTRLLDIRIKDRGHLEELIEEFLQKDSSPRHHD